MNLRRVGALGLGLPLGLRFGFGFLVASFRRLACILCRRRLSVSFLTLVVSSQRDLSPGVFFAILQLELDVAMSSDVAEGLAMEQDGVVAY